MHSTIRTGLVTVAIALQASSFVAHGELVRNGGFEEGTAARAMGWSLAPCYFVQDGAGMNGNRGLVFTNDIPNRKVGFCAQRLKLKPGFAYRFSCWAKTENIVGVATDGVKACAVVLITVYDANGKYITEYYSKKIRGTTDWTKLEGKTPKLPSHAAEVKIHPFVWHCSTGKAWFDEISMEPIEVKPVSAVVSSAYRDIAWEGDVTFYASIAIDPAATPLDTLSPEFAYSDGSYGTVRVPADRFTPFEASVTLPVAKIPLGSSNVSFELWSKNPRKLIAEESVTFTRTERAPQRKAWIDSRNRLIVDGKPFFPLGYYAYNIDKAILDAYCKGPFNCIMPYPYLSKAKYDLIASRGLKIIATLKDFMPGARHAPIKKIETQGDADRGFIHRMEMVKNHPAVIAWYINDESSVSHLPRLQRQYRLLRAADPDHPAWSVLFQHDQIRMYIDTCDVIGTDPYPIATKPIGSAAEYARETMEGFFGRPIWQVPQAFAWKWCISNGNDTDHRMPTKEECRSMFWQAIANGANGIVPYCFGSIMANMKKDEFTVAWREQCEIGEEIAAFIPVLLADPSANATGYPEGVSGRVWIKNGATYLLVVNETREAKSVSLKMPEAFRSVKAMLDPSSPVLSGSALKIALKPIGVTMLCLER